MSALQGKLVFPIKWGHKGAQNGALSVEKFWACLHSWCHLMGRNWAHSMDRNPGIANLVILVTLLNSKWEVLLVSRWTGLDTTNQENTWLFECSINAYSKPVKLETSCIVILPPTVSVLWLCHRVQGIYLFYFETLNSEVCHCILCDIRLTRPIDPTYLYCHTKALSNGYLPRNDLSWVEI